MGQELGKQAEVFVELFDPTVSDEKGFCEGKIHVYVPTPPNTSGSNTFFDGRGDRSRWKVLLRFRGLETVGQDEQEILATESLVYQADENTAAATGNMFCVPFRLHLPRDLPGSCGSVKYTLTAELIVPATGGGSSVVRDEVKKSEQDVVVVQSGSSCSRFFCLPPSVKSCEAGGTTMSGSTDKPIYTNCIERGSSSQTSALQGAGKKSECCDCCSGRTGKEGGIFASLTSRSTVEETHGRIDFAFGEPYVAENAGECTLVARVDNKYENSTNRTVLVEVWEVISSSTRTTTATASERLIFRDRMPEIRANVAEEMLMKLDLQGGGTAGARKSSLRPTTLGGLSGTNVQHVVIARIDGAADNKDNEATKGNSNSSPTWQFPLLVAAQPPGIRNRASALMEDADLWQPAMLPMVEVGGGAGTQLQFVVLPTSTSRTSKMSQFVPSPPSGFKSMIVEGNPNSPSGNIHMSAAQAFPGLNAAGDYYEQVSDGGSEDEDPISQVISGHFGDRGGQNKTTTQQPLKTNYGGTTQTSSADPRRVLDIQGPQHLKQYTGPRALQQPKASVASTDGEDNLYPDALSTGHFGGWEAGSLQPLGRAAGSNASDMGMGLGNKVIMSFEGGAGGRASAAMQMQRELPTIAPGEDEEGDEIMGGFSYYSSAGGGASAVVTGGGATGPIPVAAPRPKLVPVATPDEGTKKKKKGDRHVLGKIARGESGDQNQNVGLVRMKHEDVERPSLRLRPEDVTAAGDKAGRRKKYVF